MELVGGQGFESLWQCSRCFVLCLGCVVAVGTDGSMLLYWEPGYAKKGIRVKVSVTMSCMCLELSEEEG